jgi:hypothetical protein
MKRLQKVGDAALFLGFYLRWQWSKTLTIVNKNLKINSVVSTFFLRQYELRQVRRVSSQCYPSPCPSPIGRGVQEHRRCSKTPLPIGEGQGWGNTPLKIFYGYKGSIIFTKYYKMNKKYEFVEIFLF